MRIHRTENWPRIGGLIAWILLFHPALAAGGSADPGLGEAPLVVIDAGHGGTNRGALGEDLADEKETNLALALRVKELLEEVSEVRVALTRWRDVHLGLKERAEVANGLNARLLLSIHCNSAGHVGPQGFETYYHEGGPPGVAPESKRLARLVLDEMVSRLPAPSRGVRRGRFDVLLHAQAPATVVEVGFLNHPQEGLLLQDPAYQERIARALASGVLRFLHGVQLPADRPARRVLPLDPSSIPTSLLPPGPGGSRGAPADPTLPRMSLRVPRG